MVDTDVYAYDVALSFAGEDRGIADELARMLHTREVRVFYDAYETAELWGKDLYQHLQWVYRDSARYCVILVSRYYLEKVWTRHELHQAQARAFRERREYLLPLRLDATELPGLNATVGYVSIRSHKLDSIADLLAQKVFGAEYEPFSEFPPPNWDGEFELHGDGEITSSWSRKMKLAQERPFYEVSQRLPRIPFGSETNGEPEDGEECIECGVRKSEYHVPSCLAEECPACHGQAASCACAHVALK